MPLIILFKKHKFKFCFQNHSFEMYMFCLSIKFEPNLRKRDYCPCQNKDAYQLCSNFVHGRLCFRCKDSTNPPLSKSKISSFQPCFSNCTGRFVSHMIGNPEDMFSHVAAYLPYVTVLANSNQSMGIQISALPH